MVNFNKKRICHKCREPATYFYKQWWCGHTRDLKGVCINKKERKNETDNNT